MHSIRKGASYYQWEPESGGPTAWDLMTVEDKLKDLRRYAHYLGYKYGLSWREDRSDDCAQEAIIAAWRAFAADPATSRPIVYIRMKQAVVAVALRGYGHTGSIRAHGGGAGWRVPADQTTELPVDRFGHDLLEDVQALQEFEKVELHQLEDDVRSAVKALPEHHRELVYWLFWEEMSYPDIAKLRGVKAVTSVRTQFYKRIRPVLAERLQHHAPAGGVGERQHRWTPEDDERIIEMAEAGWTYKAMAKEMGMTPGTCHWRAKKLGLILDRSIATAS